MRGRQLWGALIAVTVLVTGCAGMMGEKKSLYDRLGGKSAIEAMVDDLMVNVAADARIQQRFAGANLRGLKQNLVEQICEVTGGPCIYTGRNMRTAHTGMAVTETEFDAVIEDMSKTLDKFQVAADNKAELIGALAKMKGDIVGR